MSTAALLCPGPSLARLDPRSLASYGLTIGVNRAVTAFACDWWAFLDFQVFLDNRPAGTPDLFTQADALASLRRHGADDRLDGRHAIVANELDPCVEVRDWRLFTAPASLVLAMTQGVQRVDVYGADWTDAPDFDGERAVTNRRDAQRWEQEGAIWGAVVGHLAKHGVVVARRGT